MQCPFLLMDSMRAGETDMHITQEAMTYQVPGLWAPDAVS